MPKRRWKSMQDAYDQGRMVGFLSACELFTMLNDPQPFIEGIEATSNAFAHIIREAQDETGATSNKTRGDNVRGDNPEPSGG